VTDRIVVALDHELRPGQAVDRVEVSRERCVGHPLQVRSGLVDAPPGLGNIPGVRVALGERGGGGAYEEGVLERFGRSERLSGEVALPVDVEREERSGEQREQGGDGLWGQRVGQRFEGIGEASPRLLVAAEEVLSGCAGGGERDP
jgi:hypothetical protein